MEQNREGRQQVARSARPDAIEGNRAYLIKNVSRLRLTYQIRLLTALAMDRKMKLVVLVPKTTNLSPDLERFAKEHARFLKMEWGD